MAGRKSYYGIIGNGETVALVSPQAGIDWFCLPRFDGKLVFTRALDPVNGKSCTLSFFKDNRELLVVSSTQMYRGKTNVLETQLEFLGLSATIVDFMPWKGISEFMEDKRIIYRIVRIRNTSRKTAKVSVKAKSAVSTKSGFAELGDGEIFYEDRDFVLGAVLKDTQEIVLLPGMEKSCLVALLYGKTSKDFEKKRRKLRFMDPETELRDVEKFWKDWLARGRKMKFGNPEYENVYCRSLLLIKLLIYDKTGAVLAAPTASFPATPGGSENWDYRFMWIRDSFFACRALLKAGHSEEAKKQLDLFYRIQAKNGHWTLPFYTIAGEEPGAEIIVEGLRGPHGEDSIRLNNDAKDQLQLDSEGSVLHLTYLYYRFTKDIEFLKRNWNIIRRTASWIVKNHNRKENGLWELREEEHKLQAHWTYGKVMCCAGLLSAIEIAETINKQAPDEWYSTESSLRATILKKAWSSHRKAFVQTFDSDAQMDISALSIEDYGLLSPFHSRMQSTAKQMEESLTTDGRGVKRFEDAVIPFYLPTLWLANHFIRVGNKDKALKYIDAAILGSTDLYLCAEHFDPLTGVQHGNFPQTFSAAAFIECLTTLVELRSFKLLEKVHLSLKEAFRYIAEM